MQQDSRMRERELGGTLFEPCPIGAEVPLGSLLSSFPFSVEMGAVPYPLPKHTRHHVGTHSMRMTLRCGALVPQDVWECLQVAIDVQLRGLGLSLSAEKSMAVSCGARLNIKYSEAGGRGPFAQEVEEGSWWASCGVPLSSQKQMTAFGARHGGYSQTHRARERLLAKHSAASIQRHCSGLDTSCVAVVNISKMQ